MLTNNVFFLQVYLQIFAGTYFINPPLGVPTFDIDMYYITMNAYWPSIYPLSFWWCYAPFYVCSIIPIFCYYHELEDQKFYMQLSILFTVIGCCTLGYAMIQYCTAITQGLLVYENMFISSNNAALSVSVDWVRGSRYLCITAMSSIIVMLLYVIMNLCILLCPFIFTLPMNYIAVDRGHNTSIGASRVNKSEYLR